MVEQAESSFSSTLKFAENSLKHSGEAASHLYNEVANSLSTDWNMVAGKDSTMLQFPTNNMIVDFFESGKPIKRTLGKSGI